MTLAEAISTLTELEPKAAGHLIKPNDWNRLVQSVQAVADELSGGLERLAQVEADAAQLRSDVNSNTARLDNTEADLASLQSSVAPLLDQYLVTTRCDRVRYAIGEVCVITAEVTQLDGSPLTDRPWIDFVASWGRLRAVSSFSSRAGVGDNSLSVRVNNEGIAQVQLRSNHSEGFTEEEENDVELGLQAVIPANGLSIAQTFLAANTPAEESSRIAFRAVSEHYERTDSIAMRSYFDTFYVRTPEYQARPIRPNIFGRWRDYRATVMAMAKPDSDPTTADYSRGASSIQITFRDWLSNWINDYVLDIDPGVSRILPDLRPIFERPIRQAVPDTEDFINDSLAGLGVIGRAKQYGVLKGVIGQLGNATTDPAVNRFRDQTFQALAAQEATDVSQLIYAPNEAAAASTPAASAFFATQRQASQVEDDVAQLSSQVEDTRQFGDSLAVLEGRMQASESIGINIDQRLNLINDSVRAINVLDESSIQSGVNRIAADTALIRTLFNNNG